MVVGLALLLCVAGGIAAAIVIQAAGTEAETQLLRQHRARFEAAALTMSRHGRSSTPDWRKALSGVSGPDVVGLSLLDGRLNSIAHIGRASTLARDAVVVAAGQGRSTAWRRHERVDPVEAEHRFAKRIGAPTGQPLLLVGAYDITVLRRAVRARQGSVILYLVFGFIAVLLFGAYLAGRFIIGPIQHLTQVAIDVDTEQPDSASFNNLGGPAEIQKLAMGFGTLVERLGRRNLALEESMQQLESARDELIRSEKLALVGRLSAGVAHEIGNPLASVVGFLDYLLKDENVPPELQRELLERMDAEVDRMRTTLRQMLDFSRPGPDEPQLIHMNEIIEQTLRLVNYHRQMKGVEVRVHGTAPQIKIDPNRMSQVLANLLLNAGAAMEGQGIIDINLRHEGGYVVIGIRDSGPGVAPEDADKIFDPFWSTKPVGVGTGLGLSISHQMVDEAGGTLTLITRAPTSAEFEIRLPQ